MRTNWSAEDPVKSLRMPPRHMDDLLRRARRRWPVALITFAIIAGGLIAAAPMLPMVYTSSAVLMISARGGDTSGMTRADLATLSALVDESVEMLNSPATHERVRAQFVQTSPEQAAAIAAASGALQPNVRATARRRGESYLVDVEAAAAAPKTAKAIVDAAIQTYQFRELDKRVAAPAKAPVVAPQAVAGPDPELARLEAEKAGLLAQAQASAPGPTAVARDGKAEAALAEARRDEAAMKTLLRSEITAADVAAFRASGAVDRLGEASASFASDVQAYETALAAGSDAPAKQDDVKFRKYRILTAASQQAGALEKRVSVLRQATTAPAAAAAPLASPTISPGMAARLRQLDMQIAAQRSVFDAVAAQQSARPPAPVPSVKAVEDLEVRVVTRPSAGVAPIWSQPVVLYLAAIGIALLAAAMSLALVALASNTVIDTRDAAALVGANLLASAPEITASQLRRLGPGERHPANLPFESPASPFAGALRQVLASLGSRTSTDKSICIAVAGSQAGDGATTISLALARTAAAAGIRVLLIDADFEFAGLTNAMGIEPVAGIEALIAGNRDMRDLVVEDDVTSVHLLPSAPAGIGQGALSLNQLTAIKQMLASAKADYDMVIIDCQPNGPRARTSSMTRLADAAVIVAAHDTSKRHTLAAVARRIHQNGAKLLGVVFNFVPAVAKHERSLFESAGAPPDDNADLSIVVRKDSPAEDRTVH